MAKLVALAPLAVALATTIVLVTPCGAVLLSLELQLEFVSLHNAARADVGVAPVVWNNILAAYAESYVETRQADCKIVFSGGPYGENQFRGAAGVNYTAADVVGAWVAEKQYYDHASNTCAAGKDCFAYTQVVWSTTTSVGCAYVVCSNDAGLLAICSYNPPGNIAGQRPY